MTPISNIFKGFSNDFMDFSTDFMVLYSRPAIFQSDFYISARRTWHELSARQSPSILAICNRHVLTFESFFFVGAPAMLQARAKVFLYYVTLRM